ncbi:dnaJ homolog subfamily C member 25 homolog [Anthonomus grandis grandis]|uniref:dnaJ homolog subfamily C member 25 homolog n=1 Tax=Anthonomus grandis grandis TaxID=2921223 RepID=UPI0021663185|nr:dnaJ homolog subfamily C member 25 homolog [Anthonomus grandis grandis]
MMWLKVSTSLLCVLSIVLSVQGGLLEGIYCGKENCYDVLQVTREATKSEIARSYRRLAKQYHPDLRRDKESKEEAEELFKSLANAYEILRDDESRTDYDYMLDNPDEYYAHYYRYYRRRVAPKVDARIVIIFTITIISVVQYYSAKQRYDNAITYFSTVPKYRNRAQDIAKQEGLLPDNNKRGGKKHKVSKEEVEQVIRKVIEDKMDIKGAYAKPQIWDVIWFQLIFLPYTLSKYLYWLGSWYWRHNYKNEPFNEEEKLYLVRKYMKMGQHQFDSQEDDRKQEFLDRELWIRENFDEWTKEQEEITKKQLAENNRYKQYRRYLKQHGVSRMTFDDS